VKYARRACVVRPRYVTAEHASGELRNEERFTDRVCASNNIRRADTARLAITLDAFPFGGGLPPGDRVSSAIDGNRILLTEATLARCRAFPFPRVTRQLRADPRAHARARFRLMTGLCPGHPLLRRD